MFFRCQPNERQALEILLSVCPFVFCVFLHPSVGFNSLPHLVLRLLHLSEAHFLQNW